MKRGIYRLKKDVKELRRQYFWVHHRIRQKTQEKSRAARNFKIVFSTRHFVESYTRLENRIGG